MIMHVIGLWTIACVVLAGGIAKAGPSEEAENDADTEEATDPRPPFNTQQHMMYVLPTVGITLVHRVYPAVPVGLTYGHLWPRQGFGVDVHGEYLAFSGGGVGINGRKIEEGMHAWRMGLRGRYGLGNRHSYWHAVIPVNMRFFSTYVDDVKHGSIYIDVGLGGGVLVWFGDHGLIGGDLTAMVGSRLTDEIDSDFTPSPQFIGQGNFYIGWRF
jgi:hypothetical protein